MAKEDLEKTKPISSLSEIEPETKNSNIIEALEEKPSKEIVDEPTYNELEQHEESKFAKLKEKWNNLDKKKKISIVLLFLIFLICLIGLVIQLLSNKKEETKKEIKEAEKISFDNYYYKGGILYFLDEKEEIGSYECNNKDEKLCYIASNNNQDGFDVPINIDSKNKTITKYHKIYNNDYVFISDNNSENGIIILYSIKNKKVIEKYLDVKAYDDNYIIFENTEHHYGLMKIEEEKEIILNPTFLDLKMMNDKEYLVAKNDKGTFIIDLKGQVKSSNFKDLIIKNYSNELVVTYLAGEYSIYDYKANLIATGYEFATVVDSYFGFVNQKKLYIRDLQNRKYNEEGIPLNNTYYVIQNTYDEDNKLLLREKSFSIENKEKDLIITVYNSGIEDGKFITINKKNIEVNEKYDYLNYFDKKLYFYKDTEKQELIGYYECKNENLTNQEEELNKCFIASSIVFDDNEINNKSEEKTLTPIINNRYVFIQDGTDVINLYDLNQNKTVSSYSSISMSIENKDNKIQHYTDNIEFIALNKKKKYGLVKISEQSVDVIIKFSYEYLERMNKYILGQNSDKKWQIFESGTKVAGPFEAKPVNYNNKFNIIKIKNKNDYYACKIDGQYILKKAGLYLKLYDDFYIYVDRNDKAYIVEIDGKVINEEGQRLNSNNYTGDKPAFKVAKGNNGYILKVLDGDEYTDYFYNVEEKEEEN